MGREISHYRLLEPVAEGGMGLVWKAEDLTLNRIVAVKEIRNLTHDPDADARFLREAQAVSRIDHPNVVTFYEMVDTPDQQYLVMQYVDGQSLRKKLHGGPLEASEALDIGIQVAAALEAAHAVGVVHRDLKPENVVVTTGGIAKVLDFGVAHFNDRSTITRTGALVGTVPYMAPEQVQSRPVDSRTDLYSLGVLLYEMLSGKLPYQGRDAAALVYEIVNTTPRNLTQSRPGLPQAISSIVAQAMAKRPEDRYASATEMLHDLKLARAAIGEAAKRGFHYEQKQRKRAMFVTVISAIALVGVVTAGRPIAGLLRAGAPRLIVAPWENATGAPSEQWMSSGIMDGLIRAIGSHGGMRVVSRETLAATRESMKTPNGSQGEAAAAQMVAKQLGARYLVRGTCERVEGKIRVHCDLVDVARGTLVKTWTRDLASLEHEFHPALNGFADAIVTEVGVRGSSESANAPTQSLEALRHYQAALQAVETGDGPEAVNQARRAVEIDPGYAEAHFLLARQSLDQAETQRHIALALAHQSRAPHRVRELMKAFELSTEGDFESSIAAYEAVLAADPENFTAGTDLINLYAKTRRFQDMVALCAILHRVNPYDYSFYNYWGLAYVITGRNDRALALTQEWRARFPQQIAPLRALALLHERLGDYDSGLAVCDTMDQLQPKSASVLRGTILLHLGRMREAEALFSGGLIVPDPNYAPGRSASHLAMLAYVRHHYRTGLSFAEVAVRRSPDPYNHWIAGLLAASIGDSARANDFLRRIAEETAVARGKAEANGARRFEHHLRGIIALQMKNPTEAVRELEVALKYTDRIDGTYFKTDLGRALLAAGDPTRAAAVLVDALSFNANYPPALLYYGQASLRLGKYSQARRALERLSDLWAEADDDFVLKQQLRRLRDASVAHRPLAARASRSATEAGARG